MLFQKNPPLSLLACNTCASTGYVGLRVCPNCHGMSVGRLDKGVFEYFGEPITRYHIKLRRGRRILDKFRIFGALTFGLGFLAAFLWNIYNNNLWSALATPYFWSVPERLITTYFWLSVIAFSYLLYRAYRLQIPEEEIKHSWDEEMKEAVPEEGLMSLTWEQARKLPRRKKNNLAPVFTPHTHHVLETAFTLADRAHATQIVPAHLLLGLLSLDKVQLIFIRLGVAPATIKARVSQLVVQGKETVSPALGTDAQQVLFHAYEEAKLSRQQYVHVTELLLATIRQSEALQEILYDLNVDAEKLTNVVQWVRIRERMVRQYHKFQRAAAHHNKYGIDKAMTAVQTPYLNNFSRDLTMMAAYGYLAPCVARDKELDEVFRIVEGGRQSVLLVGERGVGKMTIVEGVAQRMVEDDVPKRMQDKRLVQLSPTSLLAGTTVAGAEERLIGMMREIRRAGNVILFVHNLHDLMGVTNEQGEGLDVAEALAEQLDSGNSFMIATTTGDGYNKHLLNSEIATKFTPVQIKEMSEDQAVQAVESKVGHVEYKENVFFSYDAVAASVTLAKKFFHEQNLPESAISLMTEVGSYAHNKKGANHLITAEDVGAVVSEKTGVPTTSITEKESDKLLRLEDAMHERVVGQDEAVELVANALRRARAEVRSDKRPIANFLFLGPTGVGKTELAKTIAEVYFGGEERMVRLDMSEFQDKAAVYRLIGQPGQQGTGLLTESVRQHPFSLVLLDELEKADPDVLNIFLQVFDDGRLTDSTGRVIDFTNTIIIATSNAGTAFVQEQWKKGMASEDIRQQLIRGELRQYYRPEFLNRFDAVVLFKVLEREEIKQIAGLMLRQVGKDLEKRGVELRVEDAALEALADVGFDPEFGARPMRRAIQDRIENTLAELILGNKLERRDVVVIGEGGKMRVEKNK